MFWIIETKEQLLQLSKDEDSFIHIISSNSNYHPQISSISSLYYHNREKGFIIAFDHSETFSLEFSDILEFLSSHKKLYCIDKKYHSYFIPSDNLVDINFTIIDQENTITDTNCDPLVYKNFYLKHYYNPDINKIIPMIGLNYNSMIKINFNTDVFKYNYTTHISPKNISNNNLFVSQV